MTFLENLLGDFALLLLQNGLLRWSVALAASLWVWLIGDEGARLRKLYLLAPFAVAALVELATLLGGGPGGLLSKLLLVQDAARKIAGPVGLGAMLAAALLGYLRGIGFVLALGVLVSAYFADGLRGAIFGALGQVLLQLPILLAVLLFFYGIGAGVRAARRR